MEPKTIAIIGALDYDLMMMADRIPNEGESLIANGYMEALGGKGVNSAIATYRACHDIPVKAQRRPGSEEILSGPAIETPRPASIADPPQMSTINENQSEPEIYIRMVGAVGDDKYGEKLRAGLIETGVDSSGVITVPNTQSSVCFVMVENDTRQNRCLFTLGATAIWKKEDFLKAEDLGHGIKPDLCIAQMEIRKEVVEQMIKTAGTAGVDFLLNAAPASPLSGKIYRYITHLIVNESEAAIMSGRNVDEVNKDTWPVICQEFLNRGVKNVVITLGAKGACFANPSGSGHCLGYRVKVVDTTGAG